MTTATFKAMGCDVVVAGAGRSELAAIVELFAEREDTFSRFRPGSELNRLNDSPSTVLALSPQLVRALSAAIDAARSTGGLVDPTLGRAIVAAGYDRDFPELVPDHRPVGSTEPGRWRELRLSGRLLRRPPGLHLDLNGVVKGMAVDDAVALLPGAGFVAAGGDLAVRGSAVVALPGGGAIKVLRGGLATSGTATRHWSRGGRLQHHLLDPGTGLPAESPWTHVTVSGRDCLAADVAAKAAFLLGHDGPDWLDERGLPGRFLAEHGVVVENRSWNERLAANAPEPACT